MQRCAQGDNREELDRQLAAAYFDLNRFVELLPLLAFGTAFHKGLNRLRLLDSHTGNLRYNLL
ncbi:hypothetical protein D3C86_2098990 [compost metagenome]